MKKAMIWLLLLSLLLPAAAGCSGNKSADEGKVREILSGIVTADDLPENTGATETLGCRYRAAESWLPAGYAVVNGAARFDESSGTVIGILRKKDSMETVCAKLTFDGRIEWERVLALPQDAVPAKAAVGEKVVYWITEVCDTDTGTVRHRLHAMDLESGMKRMSDEIDGLFLPGWSGSVYFKDLTVDGDGYPVLLSEDEIGVFTPALEFLGKTDASFIQELTVDENGLVRAVKLCQGIFTVIALDPDTLRFSESYPVPADPWGYGARQFRFTKNGELVWRDDAGVQILQEDGTAMLLLDWQNSSLDGRDAVLCAAPDKDRLLLCTESWAADGMLSLWVPAEDLGLSELRVIEMASTVQVPDYLASAVVRFNGSSPDTRIALKDYHAVYGGDADARLLDDILTGAYRPDLVVGKTGGEDLDYFREHGMTLNLMPFLEADETVSPNDLLGCVKRAFSTEDGGIWAIPDDFSVRTLAATAETAEESINGWSLDDFLDYVGTLAPGRILMGDLTRANAADTLLGQEGYGIFFARDAGICTFDHPLYMRWISFMMSLPADEEELSASSEFERAEGKERIEYYRNGQVALTSVRLSTLSDILAPTFIFGTREWDFVGYPTESGASGSVLESGMVFAVMSWAVEAEKADRAWELVRSVVTEKEGYAHSRHGFGILLSQLKADLAVSSRYDYYYYYASDRGHGASLKNGEQHLTDKDLKSPGQVIDFVPEDGTRLLDYLEHTAGQPMSKNVPEGMMDDLTTSTPLYAASFLGYSILPELSVSGFPYDSYQ